MGSTGVTVLPEGAGIRTDAGASGRRSEAPPSRWGTVWETGDWLVAVLAASWLAVLVGLVFWTTAPMLLQWEPRVVLTGSMMPHIKPGDVVLVSPVDDPLKLPVGRIIVVRDPSRRTGTYVHRIVKHDEKTGDIITKGDANPTDDNPPVTADRVLGQVHLLVPRVGLVALWATNHDFPPLASVMAGTWLASMILVRWSRLMAEAREYAAAEARRHPSLSAPRESPGTEAAGPAPPETPTSRDTGTGTALLDGVRHQTTQPDGVPGALLVRPRERSSRRATSLWRADPEKVAGVPPAHAGGVERARRAHRA